jgi:hypothetical protein
VSPRPSAGQSTLVGERPASFASHAAFNEPTEIPEMKLGTLPLSSTTSRAPA